ncbi:hypothetical protein BSKO_13996 [Bryopsis sp. KO-2023]|nr:hypothetical protein BSKO_13996 [Bryopsis sp. KO-2023]
MNPRLAELRRGTCDDVVSRIEVLPDKSAKLLFRVLYVGVGFGLAVLLVGMSLKVEGFFEGEAGRRNLALSNLVSGCVCSVVMTVCLGSYIVRLLALRREDVRWSKRRKRWTLLHLIEFLVHFINTVLFLAPNAYYLSQGPETSTKAILILASVRFTLWSTTFFLFVVHARMLNLWVDAENRPVDREDGIMVDAPLKLHWPLSLIWLFFQAVPVYILSHVFTHIQGTGSFDENLENFCNKRERSFVWVAAMVAYFVVYQMAVVFFISKAYNQLSKKSYNVFRWTNVRLRPHHHTEVMVVGSFIVLSFSLLSGVKFSACSTLLFTWLGLCPAQLAMTLLSAINCYFMIPIKKRPGMKMHVEHFRLSWKEEPSFHHRNTDFSFERSLKLWYWSLLAYRIPGDDPEIKLDVAKGLYDLPHHEAMHIGDSDSTVVIGWSSSMIVISFRGTSSMENIKTDLRFMRVPHPPARGRFLLCTQPLIHEGFLESWTAGGLNVAVLNKVVQIVVSPDFDRENAQVLLTGHSMGGSLAVLAAFDVARYCGLSSSQISCYTFGAPRVGNPTFAREYNKLIPDTWQVVNGNDMVPGIPKFFKHVGKRVIITPEGDMIVCPLFVENSLYRGIWLSRVHCSLGQHLMRSYRKSLVAIARAQFIKRKGLPGGMQSIKALLSEGESGVFVQAIGLRANSLLKLHNWGTRAWRMEKDNLGNLDKKKGCKQKLNELVKWYAAKGKPASNSSDDKDRGQGSVDAGQMSERV